MGVLWYASVLILEHYGLGVLWYVSVMILEQYGLEFLWSESFWSWSMVSCPNVLFCGNSVFWQPNIVAT